MQNDNTQSHKHTILSHLKSKGACLKFLELSKEQDNKITLVNDDSANYLKTIESNSIASIICDPPYGISFQNNDWDKELPMADIWKECLRILKPGGYILAFSSARTYHKLATQIEDVGFTTHQMLTWIYSSGLPKGTNLSYQIEKNSIEKPNDEFRAYLKYAIKKKKLSIKKLNEICNTKGMVQHYLSKKQPQYPTLTIWNILKETLDLDDKFDQKILEIEEQRQKRKSDARSKGELFGSFRKNDKEFGPQTKLGKKWFGYRYGLQALKPTLEPIYMGQKPYIGSMPENIKEHNVGALNINDNYFNNNGRDRYPTNTFIEDRNSTKMLFDYYKKDSHEYFQNIPFIYCSKPNRKEKGEFNFHPTVKPIELMSTLVSLVTPKGETCLDPFMGSGTTALACKRLDIPFIGIEKSSDYYQIAQRRVKILN